MTLNCRPGSPQFSPQSVPPDTRTDVPRAPSCPAPPPGQMASTVFALSVMKSPIRVAQVRRRFRSPSSRCDVAPATSKGRLTPWCEIVSMAICIKPTLCASSVNQLAPRWPERRRSCRLWVIFPTREAKQRMPHLRRARPD
jgi:hypothetical protein